MTEWHEHEYITDDMIEMSNGNAVAYIMEAMRMNFDRVKSEEGFPENARPLWRISWEYVIYDD
jgi:hypothetical protein